MVKHPNRTSAFDIARLARTPGVESKFTFRPALLTVRIRTAAQKMVRERLLRGGWNSKSRSVAKLVMDTLGISYAGGHSRYLKLNGGLPADVQQDLQALCHADAAGYLLDDSNPHRVEWMRTIQEENLRSIFKPDPNTQLYIEFRAKEFSLKAYDRLARHHMSITGMADAERAARAAAFFNDPDFRLEVYI